ncbi:MULTISPECIES: hypothetical protein [unclassified Moorena]|uniref:hypothetical protein n=1 Tax=unclassified Moorena TaxID=2683338 RepID=UPI0013C2633B|nr:MULTISPECIES: hypothetical protein [unclassified Moorena]NEO05790.1 hypothetical protein [Moorena sp. SIO3I8]NEO21602.1 hypothetical protein [Moorena sp. SIO4A5]NEQ61703.1 hypothetical protein [Moorena sp. SIO4A1]
MYFGQLSVISYQLSAIAEVRSQKSEVRSQKSEVRSQKSNSCAYLGLRLLSCPRLPWRLLYQLSAIALRLASEVRSQKSKVSYE